MEEKRGGGRGEGGQECLGSTANRRNFQVNLTALIKQPEEFVLLEPCMPGQS